MKFLSVNSIVIAAAKTGKDNNNKKAVTKTDHTNRGILYIAIPRVRMFKIVTIKLIAPIIDEAPDRCKLKIARSTAGPE